MSLQPNDNRDPKKYTSMLEVPSNELSEWLEDHCFSCGTPLILIERDWHLANFKAAEDATYETLAYYMERYETQSYEEARELIRQGVMEDYPIFTVLNRMVSPLDIQTAYYSCADCFNDFISHRHCREDLPVIMPN